MTGDDSGIGDGTKVLLQIDEDREIEVDEEQAEMVQEMLATMTLGRKKTFLRRLANGETVGA